jgi:hypothetical protein
MASVFTAAGGLTSQQKATPCTGGTDGASGNEPACESGRTGMR